MKMLLVKNQSVKNSKKGNANIKLLHPTVDKKKKAFTFCSIDCLLSFMHSKQGKNAWENVVETMSK